MTYYAIREVTDYMCLTTDSLEIEKIRSLPVDKLMALSGSRHKPGFYEYPTGVYIHLSIIYGWQYDMLKAFDVPEVDHEFIAGMDKAWGGTTK